MQTVPGQRAGYSPLPGHPDYHCSPLTDAVADKLVARTLDPADERLRAMTHDASRFSCREQIERWRRGARETICLIDSRDDLAGIFWVTEKSPPERDDYFDPDLIRRHAPSITVAIRLYGSARGHGLAKAFIEHSLEVLLRHRVPPPSLWYETRANNIAIRVLATQLGFEEVSGDTCGTVIGMRASAG